MVFPPGGNAIVSAPFEVSNPSTQAFGERLPSIYEVVYRPGYVRGGAGTNSGSIYGNWGDVVRCVATMAIIQSGTKGGALIWIRFDGTDPSNPSPSNECAIPNGSAYALPDNCAWYIEANSSIVFGTAVTFSANYLPPIIAGDPTSNGITTLNTAAAFSLADGAHHGCTLKNVAFGTSTEPLVDVRSSSTLVIDFETSSTHAGAFVSTDSTGTIDVLATVSSTIPASSLGAGLTKSIQADASSIVDASYTFTLIDAAIGVSYDHTSSGLTATNVQAAIDEIVGAQEVSAQYVVRPGYTGSDPGIYTTLTAALAAANAHLTGLTSGGPIVDILFDATDPSNLAAPYVVPEVAAFTLPPQTRFLFGSGTYGVTFQSATTLNHPPIACIALDPIIQPVVAIGGTTPLCSVSAVSTDIVVEGCTIGGALSAAYVFDMVSGATLNIYGDFCTLGQKACDASTSHGFLQVVGYGVNVEANAFSAALKPNVTMSLDSTSTVDASYSAQLTSLASSAKYVGYTPTTPSDWLIPPTEVAAALDELAATPGGVLPGTQIVWRPGGVRSGNVFPLFADACAACAATSEIVTFVWDGSLGALNIPAGTYDFGKYTAIVSLTSASFADGVSFTYLPLSIDGLVPVSSTLNAVTWDFANTTNAPWKIDITTQPNYVMAIRNIMMTISGSKPIFDFSDVGGGNTLTICFEDSYVIADNTFNFAQNGSTYVLTFSAENDDTSTINGNTFIGDLSATSWYFFTYGSIIATNLGVLYAGGAPQSNFFNYSGVYQFRMEDFANRGAEPFTCAYAACALTANSGSFICSILFGKGTWSLSGQSIPYQVDVNWISEQIGQAKINLTPNTGTELINRFPASVVGLTINILAGGTTPPFTNPPNALTLVNPQILIQDSTINQESATTAMLVINPSLPTYITLCRSALKQSSGTPQAVFKTGTDRFVIYAYEGSTIAQNTLDGTTQGLGVTFDSASYIVTLTDVGDPTIQLGTTTSNFFKAIGLPTEITYQPGGSDSGYNNTFLNIDQIIAYALLANNLTVFVDLTNTASAITWTGVTLPTTIQKWKGVYNGYNGGAGPRVAGLPTITMTGGTKFSGIGTSAATNHSTTTEIEDINIIVGTGNGPVAQATTAGGITNTPNFTLSGQTTISIQTAGSDVFLDLPTTGTYVAQMTLRNEAALQGDVSKNIVNVEAGNALLINVEDAASITAHAIIKGAGSVLTINLWSGSADVDLSYGIDIHIKPGVTYGYGNGAPTGIITGSPGAMYVNAAAAAAPFLYMWNGTTWIS